MKIAPLFAFLFAIPALIRGADGAEDWNEAKSGDGIVVSTRTVPGWGMKEFRAVMRVQSPLGSIVALLEDVGSYPLWFSDCKEARVLKSLGPRERYVFFVDSAPFPVRDREIISHDTFDQNAATGVVTMSLQGEPDYMPPASGRVRVPRFEGSWTFTPLAEGGVEVVYQVRCDPGGSLPNWLANATVSSAPWNTLDGMRRMLAGEKYKDARPQWLR
jgi:ribosome-associated toxin RatA of RatAB toxin-antitoxin module